MQTLYPSRADCTKRDNSSNTSACDALGVNTLSNENSCFIPRNFRLQLIASDPSDLPTSIVQSSIKFILHSL